MKLLIDIGNQRIKWATSEQLNVSVGGLVASQSDIDKIMCEQTINEQTVNTHSADLVAQIEKQFRELPAPESVWVSCVAAEFIRKVVVEICQILWQLSPICMHATVTAVGVENGYQNPATLGVDRWVANVGARHIGGHAGEGAALVVIDAGTAVTIDYINREGRFLGGIIFPGMVTMIESLHSETGQIKAMADDGNPPSLATTSLEQVQLTNTNTQSAVKNGVILAVVAGIDKAIDRYLISEYGELKIIITGGDAECIANLSIHNMTYESNLVLIGLFLLSEQVR